MSLDVEVEDPCHLGIEPGHEPLAPLDDGCLQLPRPEGLGELEPDVAAADDDGARGALVDLGDDAVHVGDVTQHVDPRVIGARDGRSYRFGPGAQHELVVRLPVRSPLPEVAHLDLLGITVDADDVLSGTHVEREALGETLGRLEQEALAVRDLPADVVGQPAVGERDVLAALEHDDLG